MKLAHQPIVRGLAPGWILRSTAKDAYWHYRGTDGICICAKSWGPQLKCLKFSPDKPEGGGRHKPCTDCTIRLNRLALKVESAVKNLQEEITMTETDSQATVEPPVLYLLPHANDPAPTTPPIPSQPTESWTSLKEIAQLVDRNHAVIWGWCVAHPELGWVKGKGVPTSSLALIEDIDKKSPRHQLHKSKEPQPAPAVSNQAPIDMSKPKTVPATVTPPRARATSASMDLPQEYKLLAAFLKIPEGEFLANALTCYADALRRKAMS